MKSSLRECMEKASAIGRDEPGWKSAVARAAQLIEPQWLMKGWEWKRPYALDSLALILFALDRDEQLDDQAALIALAPYVHTPGTEYLHTADVLDATLALFAERLPDVGGPLSRLITSLTVSQAVDDWAMEELPSMDTPDVRMRLAPALEWLDRGLGAGAPAS
ncbi:hypothetical protein ACFWP5_44175 [Streptomyces sp. NPDC058469]|uniref:hypothetical protein n=1 Tax=Streptomyces sp. NPDC058469 TaxID=3346514 RepID=UPI0036633ACC